MLELLFLQNPSYMYIKIQKKKIIQGKKETSRSIYSLIQATTMIDCLFISHSESPPIDGCGIGGIIVWQQGVESI